MTACDGIFNNHLEIQAQCDGCEGCEGISRCVTTFSNNKFESDIDIEENKHDFPHENKDLVVDSKNKNIQNIETHMEMPSHPSHPHIRAQYGMKAILMPSHPSHHCTINEDVIIETGLDFILSHFIEEPLFPRKISTYKSQINKPYQFPVSNKQEIINAFTDSNFIDCRINAYPSLTEYKGIQRYKPNLLFIDLDKKNNNDSKSIMALKLALSNTLRNIKEVLDGHPTVLGSGNGYHIIQPVYCRTALENVIQFNGFDRPSEQFLRFAKDYLSNGKADKNNNPSFRSCLLRIPNSINSKNNNSKVTIVQQWNGYRPPITKDLLLEFRRYLIQKKIKAENIRQKILEIRSSRNNDCCNSNYYAWIETKVLKTALEDQRKLIVGIILAPYLVVIKKLSYDQSYQIINEWLMRCHLIRKLDFDPNYLINNNIKTSMKKLIPPISIYKLETNYRNLFLLLLVDQNNNNNKNNSNNINIDVKEEKVK